MSMMQRKLIIYRISQYVCIFSLVKKDADAESTTSDGELVNQIDLEDAAWI